ATNARKPAQSIRDLFLPPPKDDVRLSSVAPHCESFASGISLFREPYPRQDRHRDVVSVNFRTDLPQTPIRIQPVSFAPLTVNVTTAISPCPSLTVLSGSH
ncbi:hypothetical protein ACTXJX_19010, partial [Glutamicibacter ardleyensis]